MKIDLDSEDVRRIIEALDRYYAYTRATQREDAGYKELADRLRDGSKEVHYPQYTSKTDRCS